MPHESELCCFLLLLNIFFVCIIYKVSDFFSELGIFFHGVDFH